MINFLASYPKSGNTWVRCLVEAYFTGQIDINRFTHSQADQGIHYHQIMSPIPVDHMTLRQWALIRPAALHYLAIQNHKKNIVVKTHTIDANIADMPLFPRALLGKSIYLVRDPRDVARSYAAHLGFCVDEMIERMQGDGYGTETDVESGIIRNFISSWGKHVWAWSRCEQAKTIRYEDLKADPVDTLLEVLDWYEWEGDKSRCEHAVELCELSKLKAQEAENGFKEASKQTEFFGRKHDPLTPEQERRIVEAFGEEMERQGYKVREAA